MATKIWRSFDQIADELAEQRMSGALYYELAPTGLVHSGILRTLLRLSQLHEYLVERDLQIRSVLRLNDRYALKSLAYLAESSDQLGRQLKHARSPERSYANFCDWSTNDIFRVLARFGVEFESVVLVSEMYETTAFRRLTDNALRRMDAVLAILAQSQRTQPTFFHPACMNCHCMYRGRVKDLGPDGIGHYSCDVCGHAFTFSVFENEGLLAFKLETALTWKYLGVAVDVHGLNHVSASQCSQLIYENLYDDKPPLPYVVNLTVGKDGKAMSKSNRNFSPISGLSPLQAAELTQRILSTPDKRLLRE